MNAKANTMISQGYPAPTLNRFSLWAGGSPFSSKPFLWRAEAPLDNGLLGSAPLHLVLFRGRLNERDHLEKSRSVWEFCYSTHVSEMGRFQDHFDKISQNSVSAAALTTRAQAGPDVKSPKVENKRPEEPRVIGEGDVVLKGVPKRSRPEKWIPRPVSVADRQASAEMASRYAPDEAAAAAFEPIL